MLTEFSRWKFEVRYLVSLLGKEVLLLPEAVVILVVEYGVTQGGGHVQTLY